MVTMVLPKACSKPIINAVASPKYRVNETTVIGSPAAANRCKALDALSKLDQELGLD